MIAIPALAWFDPTYFSGVPLCIGLSLHLTRLRTYPIYAADDRKVEVAGACLNRLLADNDAFHWLVLTKYVVWSKDTAGSSSLRDRLAVKRFQTSLGALDGNVSVDTMPIAGNGRVGTAFLALYRSRRDMPSAITHENAESSLLLYGDLIDRTKAFAMTDVVNAEGDWIFKGFTDTLVKGEAILVRYFKPDEKLGTDELIAVVAEDQTASRLVVRGLGA